MTYKRISAGYSLVELMMVVAILSILGSIFTPRFDLVMQRANQSKAKSNLGSIRSGMGIYYTDNEGAWPFQAMSGYVYPINMSLSGVLIPKYMQKIPVPQLFDRVGSVNGLPLSYDILAKNQMEKNPPWDIFISSGAPHYTPLVVAPFIYDPVEGRVYYSNGNYDTTGNYFYDW